MTKSYQAGSSRFNLGVDDLQVIAGTRLAFIGESGSGKSTLLELLAMILQPGECGEYRFQPLPDSEIYDIHAAWQSGSTDQLTDLRSRYIGYVLQTGGLLPYLTIRDNINISRQLLQLPRGERVESLAAKLHITDQLDKLPAMLSVGQRQRAAIARALAHEPPVLIADEPTAAIDPINAGRIMQELVRLAEEMGVTLILATHAQQLVREFGFNPVNHEIRITDENTMNVTVATN